MAHQRQNHILNTLTWVLIGLYLGYVVLSSLTTWIPLSASGWLFVPLFNLIVITHGIRLWSPIRLLGFYVWVFAVSTLIENIGVLTGVPFGHYHYTEILGPQLGVVPIAIGFSYVPAAYFSWVVALLLTRNPGGNTPATTSLATPVVASIAMVMWDLSLDPLNSTIGQSWIWEGGGAYFGVPIINFVGWFVTVMAFFIPFALYLRRGESKAATMSPAPSQQFWLQALIVYFVMGLSRVLMSFTVEHQAVTDPSGTVWDAAAIVQASGLITVFTMWALVLLGCIRVSQEEQNRESGNQRD